MMKMNFGGVGFLVGFALVLSLSHASFGHSFLPLPDRGVVDGAWEKTVRANPSDVVGVTLALSQRNLDRLYAIVGDVSNPTSPHYGQYLSIDEIADLIAPSRDVLAELTQWAYGIGAVDVRTTLSRDFLTLLIPVDSLETVFDVQMHEYRHKGSDRMIIRTQDSVRLPDVVSRHVDIVTGVCDFFDYHTDRAQLRQRRRATASSSAEPEFILVQGGAGNLEANISIYCQDGTPMQSMGSTQCAVALELDVQIEDGANHSIREMVNINPDHCSVLGGAVTCQVDAAFPQYSRLYLSATTFFSDKTTATAKYPSVYVATAWVTPERIFEQYNIPQGYRATNQSNSQAVTAFEEQYISLEDLSRFQSLMGLPQEKPIVKGKNDQSKPGGEATLDIQYIMSVGAGVKSTFWSVSGPGPAKGNNAYVLTWAEQVSNTTDAPLVTSISYGDTEQGFYGKFGNYDYIHRMNAELAKMAARGLTVLAGSGDAGASNVGEAGNDISPTDPTCTPMRPFFPSNSPFVTSVSSTFLSKNSLPICHKPFHHEPILCDRVGEVAVSVSDGVFWTTGGGFSNLSNVQPWQADVVTPYVKENADQLPPQQYWNSSGRGYPDVATIGHNLLMMFGGQITRVGGTSASGPVMAGVISLLNDHRLNNNAPTLGLVTPLLYHLASSQPGSFADVTVGKNFDGDIQRRGSPYPTFCPYGFVTAPGWDAVTGLGSPNFGLLKENILP